MKQNKSNFTPCASCWLNIFCHLPTKTCFLFLNHQLLLTFLNLFLFPFSLLLCLHLQATSWYYHKKRYPSSHGSNGKPRSRVHYVQLIRSFQDGQGEGGDDSEEEEEVCLLNGSNLWHTDLFFHFSFQLCRPWTSQTDCGLQRDKTMIKDIIVIQAAEDTRRSRAEGTHTRNALFTYIHK